MVKRVGYFGKMPKAGDFVSRNIDSAVREGFDRWLQESMSESKVQMKEAWLSAFLTSPIWRFLLIDQLAPSKTILGVMIPSVDKVGRYFPLAILIELAELKLDKAAMSVCDEVLQEFEDLLLTALSEDIDQDYFDYQIGLAARRYSDRLLDRPDDTKDGLNPAQDLTKQLEEIQNTSGSVWWTEGSDSREADLLLYRSMPQAAVFASFLRDPNHFRDLEWAWEAARGLNATQQENLPVDLSDTFASLAFHLSSHRGTDYSRQNTSTATISPEHRAIVISDGRFGTGQFAMASRFLGKVLPDLLAPAFENKEKEGTAQPYNSELDRLTSFLATKFVNTEQSTLSSPLSFVYLGLRDPRNIKLLMAGDYLCLHSGRHGIGQIFNARHHSGDDPTIRQDQSGHFKSISISMEAGDRLLLANASLDLPYFRDDIHEALALPNLSAATNSVWQNATIKGVSGNLVLAGLELVSPAAAGSEL
jgi:type VI secretion system protein ImpM